MKRRLLKTIIYRLSAMGIIQAISWFLFRTVEMNLIFLCLEPVRFGLYYVYDWIWEGREK